MDGAGGGVTVEVGGWVLAGGRSSRMGRDKAVLELDGEPLVTRAVRSLREVCATVGIAGGGEELAQFGRVTPDARAGCGPLGGIVGALEATAFEWNLFLAVDVPFVPASVWRELLVRMAGSEAMGVMARVDGRVQPLCAGYRLGALGVLRRELEAGRWKVATAVEAAGRVESVDFEELGWFRNVNTPEEFALVAGGPKFNHDEASLRMRRADGVEGAR